MKQDVKMAGIAVLVVGAWETIKFGYKAIRNRRNQQVAQEPTEQQQPAVQEKPETPADPQPEDKK